MRNTSAPTRSDSARLYSSGVGRTTPSSSSRAARTSSKDTGINGEAMAATYRRRAAAAYRVGKSGRRPSALSAWSRSAMRSSTSSMPTESRIRSPGHLELGAGDAGVRHPAGVLDEGLDAAERLAERPDLVAAADRDAPAPRRRGPGS